MRKIGTRYKKPKEFTKCIFCGASPTNHEHVFSSWSHKLIRKKGKTWTTLTAVETGKGLGEHQRIKRNGDVHDLQVKCVCETRCNNGWMREIENKAIPVLTSLIKGEETRLSPEQQKIIATWVAIKVTILEYDRGGKRVSSAIQRRRLMKNRRPPRRGWKIWIGTLDYTWEHSIATNYLSLLLKPAKKDAPVRFNSQTAAYALGKFFVYVVRSPRELVIERWSHAISIDSRLRRIWPPSGFSLSWPPMALHSSHANHIADSFKNWALAQDAELRKQRGLPPRESALTNRLGTSGKGPSG